MKVGDVNADMIPDLLIGYETVDAEEIFRTKVAVLVGIGGGNFASPLEWDAGEPMELVVELMFERSSQ